MVPPDKSKTSTPLDIQEKSDGPTTAQSVRIDDPEKALEGKEASSTVRRTAILVVGMHRSGTSALTRVISLLGADLPTNLALENADNETGHWESRDIYRLNGDMMASAGRTWKDWRRFNTSTLR